MTFRMRSRILNNPEIPVVDELSIQSLYNTSTTPVKHSTPIQVNKEVPETKLDLTPPIMNHSQSSHKPVLNPVLQPILNPVPKQHFPVYKTILYNCRTPVTDTISTVLILPFDGTKYLLKTILVSLRQPEKPDSSYPFTIGVSRTDTNQQLTERVVKPQETTIKLDLFGNVPTTLTTLSLDCFSDQKYDEEVYITAVEINMTEVIV